MSDEDISDVQYSEAQFEDLVLRLSNSCVYQSKIPMGTQSVKTCLQGESAVRHVSDDTRLTSLVHPIQKRNHSCTRLSLGIKQPTGKQLPGLDFNMVSKPFEVPKAKSSTVIARHVPGSVKPGAGRSSLRGGQAVSGTKHLSATCRTLLKQCNQVEKAMMLTNVSRERRQTDNPWQAMNVSMSTCLLSGVGVPPMCQLMVKCGLHSTVSLALGLMRVLELRLDHIGLAPTAACQMGFQD